MSNCRDTHPCLFQQNFRFTKSLTLFNDDSSIFLCKQAFLYLKAVTKAKSAKVGKSGLLKDAVANEYAISFG